jgi:integrase
MKFSGKEIREKRKGEKAKAVTAPIHPEIYDFIAGRVRGSLPGAFVFVNPRTAGGAYSYQRLRKAWDALRIKAETGTLRIHDVTRHSFVSQLINAGVSIYDAMIHAGHSTVKTTERYAHPDLEGLRTNLSKLFLKKVAPIPGRKKGRQSITISAP